MKGMKIIKFLLIDIYIDRDIKIEIYAYTKIWDNELIQN